MKFISWIEIELLYNIYTRKPLSVTGVLHCSKQLYLAPHKYQTSVS